MLPANKSHHSGGFFGGAGERTTSFFPENTYMIWRVKPVTMIFRPAHIAAIFNPSLFISILPPMNNCSAADLRVPSLIITYNLTNTATEDFQPMNINFGLLPPLPGRIPKKLRGATYAGKGLEGVG